MRLFVDGDAFPNLLKPIVVRAIEKKSLQTIVVSNKKIYLGDSALIDPATIFGTNSLQFPQAKKPAKES